MCMCVLTWLCVCDVCCGVYVVLWCGVVLFCVVWCGVVLCGVVRLGMRKTPPCVDSKRLRVCVQDAGMCWAMIFEDRLKLQIAPMHPAEKAAPRGKRARLEA